LVGEGQNQINQRDLIVGFNLQDVVADAFGFVGFVEQPVALGFARAPATLS
jgi:hypothetical protein